MKFLLTYIAGPRTYTREDVWRSTATADALVLKKIIEILIREGARLADLENLPCGPS